MSSLGSGDFHLKEIHLQTECIYGLRLFTNDRSCCWYVTYFVQVSKLDLISYYQDPWHLIICFLNKDLWFLYLKSLDFAYNYSNHTTIDANTELDLFSLTQLLFIALCSYNSTYILLWNVSSHMESGIPWNDSQCKQCGNLL